MTPPLDIAALRRLASEATPGPWTTSGNDCGSVVFLHRADDLASLGEIGSEIDAQFIVAAVNALPALCDRVEEAERERDENAKRVERQRDRVKAGIDALGDSWEQNRKLEADLAAARAEVADLKAELLACREVNVAARRCVSAGPSGDLSRRLADLARARASATRTKGDPVRQTRTDIPDGYELRTYDDGQAEPYLVERHTVVGGIETHEVRIRGQAQAWVASRWVGGREAA